ncbi:MAG: NAD+ synthase, partial [Candidatus Cloacimonadota bacterium]|nr:NAD+ synthase [Candidatus Cloacimonadota bacterium]
AAVCMHALGKNNVFGLMLPYKNSHPDSLTHAKLLAKQLEITYRIVDISPMIDAYFNKYEPKATKLRIGNRAARERMCVLYDHSSKLKALVAGTGNRSELMIGYCTQYGDNACAFEPLGHLYKTEVIQLASYLNLPQAIIKKDPTADLWEGQTDEEEIGISYNKLDSILHLAIDESMKEQEIVAAGHNYEEVKKVLKMVKKSEFKRNMPPVLKR